MKMKRLLLSSSVLLMTALGLAGCGNNSSKSATSSSYSNVKTTKVVKKHSAKSYKKSVDKSNKNTSSSTKANSSSTKVSDQDVVSIDSNSSNSAANSSDSANSSATTNSSNANQSSKKANQSSSIQLGLNDVAVWTDANGVTHHVDSDGMDRQTSNGSSQITYNDWSGSLPSNAQVVQAH